MSRAGGVPRDRALGAITSIIGTRTQTVTLARPTESVGSMGETTTTTSDHQEDIWLFDPQETVVEVPTGETQGGSIMGLALDGVDIQHNDRVTHGGVEYEVDTVVGRPRDADADGTTHTDVSYFTITFTRRDI